MNLKKHVLNNKLNLITIKKDTEFSSVRIGIKAGSMDELDGQDGISHFVEHLMFQQTKNRDNNTLLRDLSLYGGEYNGYTLKNKTVYMFDTLSEDLEKTLEISSDILINSLFDSNDIERERGVIASEIKLQYDDPNVTSYLSSMAIAFPGQSISRPEAGNLDTIANITREELISHYRTYYVPENCYITIVSPYDHDHVVKLIENYFGAWENSGLKRKERVVFSHMESGEFSYESTGIHQQNIHYMFSIKGLSEDEIIQLGLATRRLGCGMSSILWKKLRNELGITYDTYATMTRVEDGIVAECFAVVAPEDIDITKKGIEEAISELFTTSAYEEGMDITKKEALFDCRAQIEYNDRLSEFILNRQMADVDIESIDKFKELIRNTTSEDLIKISKKVFTNPCIIVSSDN